MSNKVPDYVDFRKLSHSNSQRKIVDRTKDDNSENEFTEETFVNRKGGNIVTQNKDIYPAMIDKKEPKKNKGMRKFKGSETIRKMESSEDD